MAPLLTHNLSQSLPNEIERVLIRPEMANQVARAFSASVTPVIERQVKESISKNLIPSSAMHQELSREIRSEILNLKKEVLAWQNDALRGQEVRNTSRLSPNAPC